MPWYNSTRNDRRAVTFSSPTVTKATVGVVKGLIGDIGHAIGVGFAMGPQATPGAG